MCLNILREDWKPVLNLNAVMVGLQYLFLEPNADDPLNKGTFSFCFVFVALFSIPSFFALELPAHGRRKKRRKEEAEPKQPLTDTSSFVMDPPPQTQRRTYERTGRDLHRTCARACAVGTSETSCTPT